MVTPYITPSMIKNLAPFGIDWTSIPITGAAPGLNAAALFDLCSAASSAIDTYCFQPLRATVDVETLDGPDIRLTVRQSTGVGAMQMQHWPILDVLGGRMTAAGSFPRTWHTIPTDALSPGETSTQFVGGTSVPSGGQDGMNEILIAPGYIDWVNGRWGYTVQVAYLNGWPIAGVTETAAAGATTLHVDDVSGFLGTRPRLWDAADTETVHVTAVTADTPPEVLPGIKAQAGPGTLTLASGTKYAHVGTTPASVQISAMPDVVRWAGYFYAAAEGMQRGSTQISVPALPGSVTSGGQPTAGSFISLAQSMLNPLRRVF